MKLWRNKMRLESKSRTGRFNLCSDEETVSCHIAVYDDENNKIKSVNIHPEYEEDGNDVENAIYLLEEADRKVLYATNQKEWKEMIGFLKENQEKIEDGNKAYRIIQIKKAIQKLEDELLTLNN